LVSFEYQRFFLHQPEFFWQIELGLFETELPLLTERTRQGRTMIYFDTVTKPGA
jgi:hypothetical protein